MHADAACRAEPVRARYARSACFRWSDALLGQTELFIAEQTATVKRCQLLDRGDRSGRCEFRDQRFRVVGRSTRVLRFRDVKHADPLPPGGSESRRSRPESRSRSALRNRGLGASSCGFPASRASGSKSKRRRCDYRMRPAEANAARAPDAHPPEKWSADVFDDFDQFVDAVAVVAGEVDEFSGSLRFGDVSLEERTWRRHEGPLDHSNEALSGRSARVSRTTVATAAGGGSK